MKKISRNEKKSVVYKKIWNYKKKKNCYFSRKSNDFEMPAIISQI